MEKKTPYIFDEFFASGLEESISPFLKKTSKKWGKNLALKGAILSAILLILSFSLSFFSPSLGYVFLCIVFFIVGTPAFISSLQDIINLEINIDILMTLAAFFSILIGSGYEGALLLVLFALSGAMEEAVSHRAKGAIHSLHDLSPKMALVEENGKFFQRSVKDIGIGAKILVKAGEIIPLDGKIIEGSSSVDLRHLTGESIPITKKVGEEVPSGAKNIDTALTLEITRISSDSTVSKIIELISSAQKAKPKAQRFLDKFGKTYSSSIILLTFFFALILPFITGVSFFGTEGAIYRALAFMIAASPCALIIATPTAYLSSISACAKKGILLKGGITLDALSSCQAVAFDKTGTLTLGELSLSEIIPLTETTFSEKEALQVAASLEKHIVHPIATAISQKSQEESLSLCTIDNFSSKPGFGLSANVKLNNKSYLATIGKKEHILASLKNTDVEKKLKSLESEKDVIALLKINDSVFLFRLEDTIRPSTVTMLEEIRKNKLRSVMLTGDRSMSAHYVASKVGIDEVHADLKPEDKLNYIEKLSETDHLAMVGDGINDAPALARATVGISMGKVGSASAIDASDVVFLNDDLQNLSWLFSKSKKTLRIVKQNLTLALIVIFFATTPALMGYIPLWLAVILHEGGTVLVGLNSLRLLR